jgi:hypothetical protein
VRSSLTLTQLEARIAVAEEISRELQSLKALMQVVVTRIGSA